LVGIVTAQLVVTAWYAHVPADDGPETQILLLQSFGDPIDVQLPWAVLD